MSGQMAALDPPEGVLSNFQNPPTQQPMLIIASAITLFLTLGGISARTYTRVAIMRQFDSTDSVLLLCGALFIAFASVQILAGQFGQGRHLWDVTTTSFSHCLLILNIIEILYGPTMFCAKYVVLRQIESVFFNHHRKAFAYTALRVLIWANLLFYGAIFLSFILACIPRAKISNPAIPGICLDTHASIIATSAINVVSDFTILITPLVSIWQLQMPIKKKLSVATVFGVGVLANVTSIVRLYYSIALTRTTDVTWAIVPVASWALGEFTTVILVACFPYFPRLLQHFFPKNQNTGYLFNFGSFKDKRGYYARRWNKTGRPNTQTRYLWSDLIKVHQVHRVNS
ncbi:hypothetical protein F4680DRAFT_464042 [Xylaria scruposa]|nr:hypothetical protein F4680DRAFT_464042 [Xylaria scruposa]